MTDLKLWLISQDDNNDYDTYDSAVVVAKSADAARAIHPSAYKDEPVTEEPEKYSSWAVYSKVNAVEIGVAAPALIEGSVVCASFNAG
jgi:hypothetical protein